VARGRGEAAVRPVARDLARHAEEHFANEEKFMLEMDYPHLEEHRTEHRKMAEGLAEFTAALDSETPPGAKELSALMSHWLLDHILKCDKEYAAFSRERAGSGSCP
jgi:hemerythrin-like metal-binding protein